MSESTFDMLEPEFQEPYQAWLAQPGPETSRAMLTALEPVIQRGIRTYAGASNPLLASQARLLTLRGLKSYDPKKAKLGTHLYNQYQGLRRIQRQQQQTVQAPERVIFDQQKLRFHEQALTDELGREPTDLELADRTGFSLKRMQRVRKYQPGVSEGMLENIDPNLLGALSPAVAHSQRSRQMWIDMVYQDLPDLDKKVMELSLGLHGRRPMSNQEIAAKLKRSPGAISQRKARIQQMLDQEPDLGAFLG